MGYVVYVSRWEDFQVPGIHGYGGDRSRVANIIGGERVGRVFCGTAKMAEEAFSSPAIFIDRSSIGLLAAALLHVVECRKNFRAMRSGIHLHVDLHDFALRIDQESVASRQGVAIELV
jgi:hypothetical protein